MQVADRSHAAVIYAAAASVSVLDDRLPDEDEPILVLTDEYALGFGYLQGGTWEVVVPPWEFPVESDTVVLYWTAYPRSCLSLSAVCARVSHDRWQRLPYQRFAWSRRLWDFFAARLVREGGYLIIDDTCWARWAKHSEAVSWVWSSTHRRSVRGMQAVLLVWTDGRVRVPLGLRLWQKGGRSKVKLAAELLREAQRRVRPQ